jgi:hypothetical protein
MTNEDKYQLSFDRKCLLYREIGLEKIIDSFLEADDRQTILILLEAIECISSSSPNRDQNGRLMIVQEEISREEKMTNIDSSSSSTAPASNITETMMKYFRHASFNDISASNEDILHKILKIISLLCVSCGYVNHVRNQMCLIEKNSIDILLKITKRKNITSKIKCELFYCISMLTLNNFHIGNIKESIFKPETTIEYIIKSLMILILKQSSSYTSKYNYKKDSEYFESELIYTDDELNEIEVQIRAGLALCAFCYHNEDFTKKFISFIGKKNPPKFFTRTTQL